MKKNNPTGRLFGLFLVLLIGAMVWFFTQTDAYYHFAVSSVKTAAQVFPLSKEDMLMRVQPAPQVYNQEVKYRKFFITAPEAQKVELLADFNGWGREPLELTAYKKGYFETSVALAGGEYKYVFRVDGKLTPDPSNQDRQTLPDGREICIKTVR